MRVVRKISKTFARPFGMIFLCLGLLMGLTFSTTGQVSASTATVNAATDSADLSSDTAISATTSETTGADTASAATGTDVASAVTTSTTSSVESVEIYELESTETTEVTNEAVEASSSSGSATNKKIVTANTNFSTSVDVGINGYAMYDTPTVVEITISCTEDFTGSIRLLPNTDPSSSYRTSVAYEQDITLVAGEEKTFAFYPSSLGDNGKIKFSVLNSKGNEVYAETDSASFLYSYSNLLIGTLTDDFAALSYLNGIYIPSEAMWGYTKLMELNESNFPEKASVLSMFNVIVIDNYDTAKLSDAQYEALKEWVQSGGVLILGLGANYQNVLHIFSDDFLTGTIGDLESKDVTWSCLPTIDVTSASEVSTDTVTYSRTAVKVGTDYTKSATLSGVDCLDFTLDGGTELTLFADGGLASYKSEGAGMVVVVGYDLAMEPVTSFDEKEAMAYALLMIADESDFNASYIMTSTYSDDAETLAGASDNTKRPNVQVLLIILGIYVIVVGPVLYLILKAIGKREKIWLAIPGTALLFTLVIFIFTLTYQIGGPIVNTFSFVSLNGDVQDEMVYTSVTCPSASEYELLLNENYTNLQYDSYNYSYDLLWYFFDIDVDSTLEYNYLLKETNEGLKIVLENETVFNETTFAVNRTSENTAGSLDVDITGYTVGFAGTVTNNTIYDMDEVIVYFEDYYYRVGALKAGESATFTVDDISKFNSYDSTFNYYYLDSSSDEYVREMANNVMYYYYMDRSDYHGGAWGYVSDYVVDVCADTSIEESGNGVLYTQFTADYADVVGAYYADITTQFVSSGGEFDEEDGWMYDQSIEVTYQFAAKDDILTLINRDYTTEDTQTGSIYSGTYYYYWSEPYADVYIYNYETKEYEQIFTDSMYFTPDDMEVYLDDDGRMQLQYFIDSTTWNDYGYAYMPTISALGGESDAAN